ncbi:acyltransferase [Candidatus Bathyarchaeota archaeon ex4484_205]|nr:MAG: acyltransferase [Candidatus Bathyarchaeota archaeon ex4484_205]
MRPIFGEKRRNVKRAVEFIEESLRFEPNVLVLPELFNTGYAFSSREEAYRLSESLENGETIEALRRTSEDTDICIVAGYCEMDENRLYNSAVVVENGRIIGNYRKIHLFYREKLVFTPGDRGFEVFDVKGVKIGVMICFDWRFPESVRTLSLMRADVICHPTNLVHPYCQTAMLGSAVQNNVYIVTANRVGREREFIFTGRSQIVSPKMEILATSPPDVEEVKVIEADLETARDKRVTAYNHLFEDRRPEFYKILCEG